MTVQPRLVLGPERNLFLSLSQKPAKPFNERVLLECHAGPRGYSAGQIPAALLRLVLLARR